MEAVGIIMFHFAEKVPNCVSVHTVISFYVFQGISSGTTEARLGHLHVNLSLSTLVTDNCKANNRTQIFILVFGGNEYVLA